MIQVFLSHSKAMKTNIVIPFANDLSLLNLSYWLDKVEISSGDNIYTHIVEGINNSSHCIAFIDNTYLSKNWPMEELSLFHEKESRTGKKIIIPVYCNVSKEAVYDSIPWLENRAFELIKQDFYTVGERERIVCRVINRILDEISLNADISSLDDLISHHCLLPYHELLRVLYNSRYYLSSNLQLSCIELCNILALLNYVYNDLNIKRDRLINSVFKLPAYIKRIALDNPNNLDYDFIIVLKRCINFVSKDLLSIFNT